MKLVFGILLSLLGVTIAAAQPPAKNDVLPALQAGGYVLFLRHPETNPNQADTDPLNLDNTKAQRHLTDEGRRQAKALGMAFRSLKIPVGKILASKFYRAQEAARVLDLGEVETSLDISEGGLVVSPKENQRRAQVLRTLLATEPPAGKNVLIVSHKPNLQDSAGREFDRRPTARCFLPSRSGAGPRAGRSSASAGHCSYV